LRVFYSISDFPKFPFPVVTTGTFDGVHLGHQAILRRLIENARRNKGTAVVITFHPHPRMVLQQDSTGLELLNTLEERIQNLENAGVDVLLVIPFTKEFAQWSSQKFISSLLVETIGTKSLVIGYDHHFGRNREGSFENLRVSGHLYGFEVEEIPAKDVDELAVSSTQVRNALHRGDVETAAQFLGYLYQIEGCVQQGRQLGRTIGFPTANIQLNDPVKLIPAHGVYAVLVHVEGEVIKGMMNIGYNPTVSSSGERKIEVHLLDWQGNLYNKCILIRMHTRIRDEIRFNNLNALRSQLEQDRRKVYEVLNT
jgi:riboflavin kinase/FMN adenylyltransferase